MLFRALSPSTINFAKNCFSIITKIGSNASGDVWPILEATNYGTHFLVVYYYRNDRVWCGISEQPQRCCAVGPTATEGL